MYDKNGKLLSLSEVFNILPLYSIKRIEVIDSNGRSYVNWKDNNHVEIHSQDNDRTLKIFISESNIQISHYNVVVIYINMHKQINTKRELRQTISDWTYIFSLKY